MILIGLFAILVTALRAQTPAAPADLAFGIPTASTNVPEYEGCPVFTAGDYYNNNISTEAIDPHSADMIAGSTEVYNETFYLSTGYEKVNLANNETSTYTVQAEASWHQNEWNNNPKWPWQLSYWIEPAGDAHGLVLQTDECRLFETYGTTFTFSGSSYTLAAYSGWSWDLTKPFVRPSDVLGASSPAAMASGLPLFAGAIKAEEMQSGVIDHALNFDPAIGVVSQNQFVAPASSAGDAAYKGTSEYMLLYGAHLRLHSSYPCPSASQHPQAHAICIALKRYGMYFADTSSAGSQTALYGIEAQSGNSGWNSSDYNTLLNNMHLTDFDVLTVGNVQCDTGQTCPSQGY